MPTAGPPSLDVSATPDVSAASGPPDQLSVLLFCFLYINAGCECKRPRPPSLHVSATSRPLVQLSVLRPFSFPSLITVTLSEEGEEASVPFCKQQGTVGAEELGDGATAATCNYCFQKGCAAWRMGELVGTAAAREARQQQPHLLGRADGDWSTVEDGATAATSKLCFQKGCAAWRVGELMGTAAAREARQQQPHLLGRADGDSSAVEDGATAANSKLCFQKGCAAWRIGELVGTAAAREARQQQPLLLGRADGDWSTVGDGATTATSKLYFQKGVWG
ncbi:unnamed protein product [Closterium sp. Naga37s-1]|nr:unnamed protein product [Closterium sp. Naga37s-1]